MNNRFRGDTAQRATALVRALVSAVTTACVASIAEPAFAGPPDCPSAGLVIGEAKISEMSGSFTGHLDVFVLFGSSVTSPGDLNGDGIADLVVGAPYDDDGEWTAGRSGFCS